MHMISYSQPEASVVSQKLMTAIETVGALKTPPKTLARSRPVCACTVISGRHGFPFCDGKFVRRAGWALMKNLNAHNVHGLPWQRINIHEACCIDPHVRLPIVPVITNAHTVCSKLLPFITTHSVYATSMDNASPFKWLF